MNVLEAIKAIDARCRDGNNDAAMALMFEYWPDISKVFTASMLLGNAAASLIEQALKCNYVEELGHTLLMNKSMHELRESLNLLVKMIGTGNPPPELTKE